MKLEYRVDTHFRWILMAFLISYISQIQLMSHGLSRDRMHDFITDLIADP